MSADAVRPVASPTALVERQDFYREIDRLDRQIEGNSARIQHLDENGSRGMDGLVVQMTELSKDIGRLEAEILHMRSAATMAARYWITTTIAILALIATGVASLLKG